MSRPRLVLIDGSSYLYRAFHALPPLTNSAGEPTGALFGVVNMLRATLNQRPDYAAFVQDAPGRTFRDDLYAEYKANREAMPDPLVAQVEPMLTIVSALGFPILRVDGVEADDVIGTLARQAAEQGIDVVVSTGDKDFAQLVAPGITLVNTMTNTTLDAASVVEKFGVRPEQVVDYLALMGDSVDNIPGVEKCGPKTAAKWLAEYGSLDAVIANADKVGGKIGENLRKALAQLPLSRRLATIKTDVSLELGPRDLALRERDVEALRGLYKRYEFNAALKELDAIESVAGAHPVRDDAIPEQDGESGSSSDRAQVALLLAPAPAAELAGPGEYELVTTQAQLDAWIERLRAAPLIAFDTETSSLDAMRADLVGLSFAVEAKRACYIPLGHDYPGAPAQLDREAVLAALKPILEDATRPKLAQHAKYDINVLANHGVEMRGLVHDTMLESYVLHSTWRHDMDTQAKRVLGVDTIHYEDVAGKGAKQIPFSQVDLDTACRYSAEERVTLDVRVFNGGDEVFRTFALNEASVEKASRERMLEVVVEIDGRPLSRWGCDGVVCATPTGSTAYNFSAGGPVVWPAVEALLMVPISAHALFARPLVVAPTSVLAVVLVLVLAAVYARSIRREESES